MCYDCLIHDVIVALICGGISSFLVWFVPAKCVMPKIKCGTFTHINNKREISIINESKWHDAFDLICYIEYVNKDDDDIFTEVSSIPIVEKNNCNYKIKLKTLSSPSKTPKDGRPSLKMFIESQTKTVKVTITYHNKYGSRRSTAPISLEYN